MKVLYNNRDIDYDSQIFHKKFERQAITQAVSKPIFTTYWVCSIDPKLSAKLMVLIKTEYQYTSDSLRHLKRVKKIGDLNGSIKLKIIICPKEDISKDQLVNQLSQKIEGEIQIEEVLIPMNNPIDKETNMLWSNTYWPFVWKGNPLIQDLNELYNGFSLENVNKYMNMVLEKSKETSRIVVIFVDPKTDSIKSTVIDSRTNGDPMRHPIMAAINEIAKKEVKRRSQSKDNDKSKNNYLCLNYHVYTSHEPCVMCSMALVHSRIGQLIYRHSALKTGGIGKTSGDKLMIHLSCTLNWKFESYQMLSSGSQGCEIPEDFNV